MVAVCAALMIAVPAMALEVEVSGHYFVEHFNNSNITLSKDDATDDYSSMEFMAKPVFKINDNITLTTQFTALQDHVWGTDANSRLNEDDPFAPDIDDANNIDWKAAYMTVKTPIGGFIVGRYIDAPWGTGLGDSTASHGSNNQHKDRIMWVVPVGDFISGLVVQKNSEGDQGNRISDADFDKYYGFTAYKQENWSTGLLIANYTHKNFVTQGDLRAFQTGFGNFNALSAAATTARGTFTGNFAGLLSAEAANAFGPLTPALQGAAAGAGYGTIAEWELGEQGAQVQPILDSFGVNATVPDLTQLYANALAAEGAAAAQGAQIVAGPARSELSLWVANPYFMGTFGPLSVEAELLYGVGTIELDTPRTDPVTGQVFDEIDAEGLAATLDLKYHIVGFTFNGGYTYVQGDSDFTDNESSAIGYFEPSIDLEHGFLLTSDVAGLQTILGGTDVNGIPLGNLAGGPTTLTGTAGYQMFWLGAKYQVLDNLNLGLLFVKSQADDAPYLDPTSADKLQWDDDHGEEYDFTVEWNIMDNLAFKGVVAHLAAGDYWKQGDPNKEIEDNTTFYGRLIVEF
jgi:hypothetical protein